MNIGSIGSLKWWAPGHCPNAHRVSPPLFCIYYIRHMISFWVYVLPNYFSYPNFSTYTNFLTLFVLLFQAVVLLIISSALTVSAFRNLRNALWEAKKMADQQDVLTYPICLFAVRTPEDGFVVFMYEATRWL